MTTAAFIAEEVLPPLTRLIDVKFTIEELAVLASLYDIDSLPGVKTIEIGPDLRSLATRCLIVRSVVRLPEGGGVEITQPHATLLSFLFDAAMVTHVSRIAADSRQVWTWFDLDGFCVCVTEPDDGIVTMTAHQGSANDCWPIHLGVAADGTVASEEAVAIEVATVERGDLTTARSWVAAEQPPGWLQKSPLSP